MIELSTTTDMETIRSCVNRREIQVGGAAREILCEFFQGHLGGTKSSLPFFSIP